MFLKNLRISSKVVVFSTVTVAISIMVSTFTCLTQYRKELVREAAVSQENRIRTFWELVRQKGHDVKVMDGKMVVGKYVINGNFELPDKLKELCGGTATIFMGDVRVSTNVLKPDGSRAVGTRLQGPVFDTIFKQGIS